jgi:O-antigen/teichoic acid export membrane protein
LPSRTPDRLSSLLATLNIRPTGRIGGEIAWLVGGQVSILLAGVVSVRVLTERLDPEQYGIVILALTIGQLLIQTLMGGLGQGFSRYFSVAAESNDLRSFFQSCAKLLAGATVIAIVLGMAFSLFITTGILKKDNAVVFLALSFAIVSGWNSIFAAIQNAARSRVTVVLHSSFDAWIRLLLALIFLSILGYSANNVVIGYIISAVIVSVSQILILYRRNYRQTYKCDMAKIQALRTEPAGWTRQIWAFSWPFSFWGIFTWLQQSSDRWALELFSSTSDVGKYAALYQLGYGPVSMAAGLAVAVMAPIIYQRIGTTRDASRTAEAHLMIIVTAGLVFFGTVVGFLFLLFSHNLIFGIFVGLEYRDHSYLLPWMFLAGGIFAVGQVLSLKQMGDIQINLLIAPKIATASIGLALNVLGAAFAGIEGVIAAMVVFSLIYAAWMVFLSYRKRQPTKT